MHKKPSWLWIVLFFFYLIGVVSNTTLFLSPDSPTRMYHQILLGFNIHFLIPYLLNVLAIIFDILALIPFYNFLNPDKHRLGLNTISPKTWKWFFAIRFALIFVGHPYEIKQLQATLHNDFLLTAAIVNIILLSQGPSYVATFLYTHRASSYK